MRSRQGILLVLGGLLASLALWSHQAQTQEKSSGKVLSILSTTDAIGYTSPCG